MMKLMTMKTKIIIIALILIGITLAIYTWRKNVLNSNQQQTIESLQLDKQKLDSIINQQDQLLVKQETIIVDNQSALNSLTDTIFKLKHRDSKNSQTIAYYKGRTITNLSHIEVPIEQGPVVAGPTLGPEVTIIAPDPDDTSYLRLPATFSMNNDAFTFGATVKHSTITIDTFSLVDNLQMRFVERRHGLFKPHTIEVQYFHSNPYMQVTGGNSVIYQPKHRNKFLNYLIPALVGGVAGVLLTR